MAEFDKKALIKEINNSSLSPLERYVVLYRKAIKFCFPTFIESLKELLDECGYISFFGDCQNYLGEYHVLYVYLNDPKYNFYGLHCVSKDDDPDQFKPFGPVVAHCNIMAVSDSVDDMILLHGVGHRYLLAENDIFLPFDKEIKLASLLELSIDRDKVLKDAQKIVKNHKKEAICRLFEVFSRFNVPNDIYIKLKGKIILGCSLNSLLAMALSEDFMLDSFVKRLSDLYTLNNTYTTGECEQHLINEYLKKFENSTELDDRISLIIAKRKIAENLCSEFKKSKYFKSQYHLNKEDAINLLSIAFEFDGVPSPETKAPLVVEANDNIAMLVLDDMNDLLAEHLSINEADDELFFGDLTAYYLFVLLRIKEVKLSLFYKLINKLKVIKKLDLDYYVSVDIEGHNFSIEDFCVFEQARALLRENGSDLCFFGGHSMFHSLEETMKADNILDEMISKIKSFDFSPFERFLYIYNYVCSRSPNEYEYDLQSPHLSRDLMSVVTTPYCVCVGFSQILSHLCREVGIECFYQLICVFGGENHENDLVYMDDDKYNIHGLYYADPCWDSVDKDDNISTYAFCLIPLSEGKKLFDYHFESSLYLYQDPKDKYDILEPGMLQICLAYDPADKTRINTFIPLGDLERESFFKASELCRNEYSNSLKTIVNVLKELEVPREAYYQIYNVPKGTSIYYFVADYIVNKDIQYIKSQVEILKKYVVDCLNDNTKQLSIEKAVRCMMFDYYDEMSFEIDETSSLYTNVRDAVYRILMDNEIRERLKKSKYSKLGGVIDIETYRKALIEVYTKQGMSLEEANSKIEASFNRTKQFVRFVFKNGSTIQFYEEPGGFANLLKHFTS